VNDAGSMWMALTLMVLGFVLYFLPTLIAWRKPQRGSVMAINLFLGWTLVGWVVALAWAAKDQPPPQVIIQQMLPPILCPNCGKYSQPGSRFCDSCGNSFVRAAVAQ